jgi:hypothetical protein
VLTSAVHWLSPDGKALAYAVVENGVGNIRAQPLDRSNGHMLTNFTSDQISAIQFSPDGKAITVPAARSFPTWFYCTKPPPPLANRTCVVIVNSKPDHGASHSRA